MPDERATRAPSLVWLLLPNIGPSILALLHLAWPLAPLLYCGGNGLWIFRLMRQSEQEREREKEERLSRAWVPCLLMGLGSLSLALLSQPTSPLHGGLAWDGRQYAAIYSYFSTGVFVPVVPEFPFYQRIGMPFVAAHLPLPAREAFLLLHWIFWSGTMVLFAICCRLCFGLTAASIHFAVLWLQMFWLSIPRTSTNDTFTVDSAALFFIQAWIFLLLWDRGPWLLPLCAFVGVLFKETVLLVVVLSILALAGVWLTARFKRTLPTDLPILRLRNVTVLVAAGGAAVVAKSVAAGVLPHGPQLRGELDTMLGWLALRAQDPDSLLRYVAAAFAAYGGFALLWVATLGKPPRHERQWAMTVAMALCPLYFAICFVAGSDLTKFSLMAFPFALPVLLTRFDEVSPKFAVLALLLGLPAARAFAPIVDLHGRDLPSAGQDLHGVFSWMMEYAHPAIVGSWMGWWLACTLVLRSAGFAAVWRPELSRSAVTAPLSVAEPFPPYQEARVWIPAERAPRSRARRQEDRRVATAPRSASDRRRQDERRVNAADLV